MTFSVSLIDYPGLWLTLWYTIRFVASIMAIIVGVYNAYMGWCDKYGDYLDFSSIGFVLGISLTWLGYFFFPPIFHYSFSS